METVKNYYTFYTANNCKCMQIFRNKKLFFVLRAMSRLSPEKDFCVFDKTTHNLGDPDGLVAFGTGCAYWATQAPTITYA